MLLQSHEGYIHILPALPAEWAEGSIRGFKAKGGAGIDMVWKKGKPVKMSVTGGWEEWVQILIPEGMTASVKGCEHKYYEDFVDLRLPQGEKAEVRFRSI